MNETNEAGGKHYGNGVQPWDLQRSMLSWGSVFIDARRTDAIEYLFRCKGGREKRLDDARKALHNLQEIIKELEKEYEQLEFDLDALAQLEASDLVPFAETKSSCKFEHNLENAHLATVGGKCSACGDEWPKDQLPNL